MKLWGLKDIKILVVDDFPAMRSMMRSMLLNFGANSIQEAKNGEEAVELMESTTFEIVLCDYNLGEGKDGQQVLEEAKLRNLLPYSSIFILVTAENTSEMVMGAMEYQPDDYLVKPFTKPVLQMRIRKLQEKKEGLKKIAKAMDRGDFTKAIVYCDEKLQEEGKSNSELLKLKGELLIKLNNYSDAKVLYEEALLEREFEWASFGLGKVHFYLQEYQEARLVLEDLLRRNKNYVLAYDWLAKIETLSGDNKKSQQLLMKAVSISPKAVLRQKALAEAAFANEDLDVSEKAYKSVVKEGKHSCQKHPSDYGGLAKVYVKKALPRNAAQVVGNMKQTFKSSTNEILLQSAVIESLVYKDIGRDDESRAALDSAVEMFQRDPAGLTSVSAMELAEACFALGKKDQASELIKHVVRNNHEDEKVLQKAAQFFSDNGMEKEGSSIIEETRTEVININNDGVELAKQGKLQESIGLFIKASRAMPENIVINLNTAQSFIMFMQKTGVNEKVLSQTQVFLNRVREIDSSNERYQKLLLRYHELSKRVA